MKLENYKNDSYEFSKSSSDIARTLAFAGIAIIWIFKYDNPKEHLIPEELFLPLLFLVITLIVDLLQYLIPTIILTIFYLRQEKKHNGNDDADLTASYWLSVPGWLCFFSKIITLSISYILIAKFIINKL